MPTSGSTLTPIFSSPDDITQKVDASLIKGLSSQFPVEGKVYRLEASNFRAEKKPITHEDEKKAILESRSLTYPIKADLKLINKATGETVDEVNGFSLMDSFHLTNKHTLMYKGNNYAIANLLKLRPGVYTRYKENGELESHFNTGKGQTFFLHLDVKSNIFYIQINSANIPLAPLLNKVFGVAPNTVADFIPAEVWIVNLKATAGKEDRYITDMYRRLVSTSKQVAKAPMSQMIEQLKESLANSQLSEQTTKDTLGESFTGVTSKTLLLAMKNLVDISKGDRQEDNRDSLQFKRVQNLPDFLDVRFDKGHQTVKLIKNRVIRELDNMPVNDPKIRGNVAAKPFNKFFSDYIQKSTLVSTPNETNPLESIENVAKVTVLGPDEGGIKEDRGVPMGARDVHPSHLGIIDPSRTPESGHAGIDQRFTIAARRDADGNLYARVKDKSGNIKYLSVHEMMNSTIGFPHQEGEKEVQAQINGHLGVCPVSQVNYWLADTADMYTVTTNLVPFLNSDHPGRLTMAGKALPQALSLVNREVPLVQTSTEDGTSFVKQLARISGTITPVSGTVIKADAKSVTILPNDTTNKTAVVTAIKNLPFNMKGFHDDEKTLVKAGDKVSKGDMLYDSNYTRDGTLALGKNLNVAYLPWKGYNHEDGLVLSQSCADSLSSHHAYKIDYDVSNFSVTKKALVMRYFPGKFTKDQLDKLDDLGYAKVGVILNYGDPCYAVLEKREPTANDKMFGKLNKTLMTPYSLRTEIWNHEENGQVVDAHTQTKQVRFIIRSIKPLEVGDKLTGFHGNKGIVSKILDDTEMPYSKITGKPVDILLNPASVTSRVNLGQLAETAAAKIAQKTGTPYLIQNFSKKSTFKDMIQELKNHGLSDTEELIDPSTKQSLGQILTGPQYFVKLFKTSDQNWSARNVGGYDNTGQPIKGGEEGSKSVGYMEMLGLLGSNARKNLKEISTVKSDENSDYWHKFTTGQPLPKPKVTFATEKFLNYLTGSGIKTSLNNGVLTASPLTDEDIVGASKGVIKDAGLLVAKNLTPEKGGFFDPIATGGLDGTKWSHYPLAEALPNPVMEKPIKSLLGLTTKEYNGIASGTIGVNKVGSDFDLHDMVTGAKLRTVKVNSLATRPVDEELEEEEPEEPEEDISI